MVFHAHHHLLLHGKPGSLPHRGEDGVAHRLRRRPCQADEDRIRSGRGWLHHDLLQGWLQLDIIKTTVFSLLCISRGHTGTQYWYVKALLKFEMVVILQL